MYEKDPVEEVDFEIYTKYPELVEKYNKEYRKENSKHAQMAYDGSNDEDNGHDDLENNIRYEGMYNLENN